MSAESIRTDREEWLRSLPLDVQRLVITWLSSLTGGPLSKVDGRVLGTWTGLRMILGPTLVASLRGGRFDG